MNPARFLSEERVDLSLDERFDDVDVPTVDSLTEYMASLLSTSVDIVNPSRLRTDLVNRERRAPSLLGHGVALPHVRTMQARRLVMAVGVSRAGLDLPAPDRAPVRLVIALVGPPYDDKPYHTIYRALGEKLEDPAWREEVLAAELPGEVIRALAR